MELSGQGWRCSAGETVDQVALSVYGDEKYAAEILCANPELSNVPVYKGGEILRLPVVYIPQENDGMTMPQKAPWKE